MVVIYMTVALVVVAVSILKIHFSRGPLNWPVVGMMPWLLWNMTNVYEQGAKVVIDNGGTFKFRGPWWCRSYLFEVVTSTPANLEHILKKDFANFPRGPYFKEAFFDIFGDGLFTADDELWRHQRKAMAIILSSRTSRDRNLSLLQKMLQGNLLPFLEEAKEKKTLVDLQNILLQFTLDHMCMNVMGSDAGSPYAAVRFASAFDEAVRFCTYRLVCPPFLWKIMRFLNVGFEKKLRAAQATIHQFISERVKFRVMELEEEKEVRGDILSSFMKYMQAEEGRFPSEKMLQDLTLSMFLAGRDTSAVAISWFFWLLSMHPNVERKIVSELSNILKLKQLGTSDENSYEKMGFFDWEELRGMNYLHAALTESMRLYPPVPLSYRESTQENVLPDGTHIKKGSKLVYFIYATNRMETIWGEDAREFKPERWINIEGEFIKKWDFKYPVFNAGPRICLGKDIAYVNMKCVVSNILARYRVKVESSHQVKPEFGLTLFMKHGLKVSLHPRNLYPL